MKKFTVGFASAGLLISTIAVAGFTEINSSGDIVSKDSSSAQRLSFSSPNQNIPAPLRSYSLWEKISETTKYTSTVPKVQPSSVVETPVAISIPLSSSSLNKPTLNSPLSKDLSLIQLQTELAKAKDQIKKYEAENTQLKFQNLEMSVKVIEMNRDLAEVKKQVNFLASQMQNVESDVLVMKNKNTSWLARN
ncbi:TPA: hypothetical protein MW242_001900 [Acinetobacter baumannii]|nr:hypothetical protein [Acinetobacter baumannii]